MYEVYIGSQADPLARDWKWPACWGNKYQEQLGNFKSYVPYDLNIKIFGNGENVDVLVYDVAVSWDSPELSDENGVNRIITRDWEYNYNNDNGIPNTRPKWYARHPTGITAITILAFIVTAFSQQLQLLAADIMVLLIKQIYTPYQ